jgi:FtsP/CotA-like multicopper oxidase with cupredoxin domain
MNLSRRDALKLSALASAALGLPLSRTVSTASQNRLAASGLPRPFTTPFGIPPVLTPVSSDATTDYYELEMRQGLASIVPGLSTPIWGYNGIAPGPTIVNRKGRKTVVRQTNSLPAQHPQLGYQPWTSVHLHGSESLPEYDGYASDITLPGQFKNYHYPNSQEARTLWYHDHGVMHTAPDVYMGLAGQYWLQDDLEISLPIPKGRYDIPLIVQDVMLDSDGTKLWNDNDQSGIFGDIILVNGRPWPVMKVERRKYRFRILNASVSRSYRWQLDSGEPLVVIATDAGFTRYPQPVTQFRHGVAERYEVIIDFAKYPIGREGDEHQEQRHPRCAES